MKLIRKSYRLLARHTFVGRLRRAADLGFARRKLLGSEALSGPEKTCLRKVSLRIHPNDEMYAGAQHYLSVGMAAVRCIEQALTAARVDDVRTILDCPCGYGRVLRFLRLRFPDADITASEINTKALDFCRRWFSVESALSDMDFSKLSMPKKFDLIWCGSLVTHLEEQQTVALLKFFHDHLSAGGLCVFTTHGPRSAEWIRAKTQTYQLTEAAQEQVLSEFHQKGYGYADYPNQRGYGISLTSHERMLAIAADVGQWKEACYLEHGWGEHQDVYGLVMPKSKGDRAESSRE